MWTLNKLDVGLKQQPVYYCITSGILSQLSVINFRKHYIKLHFHILKTYLNKIKLNLNLNLKKITDTIFFL